MKNFYIRYSLFFVFYLFLQSCYSFAPGLLHKNSKTIKIERFTNHANYMNPFFSEEFSNVLQDQFIHQTKMKLVDNNPDVTLSGEILSYEIIPLSMQYVPNVNTSKSKKPSIKNRFIIDVKIKFTSKQQPEKNFEKIFSNYHDFEYKKSLDNPTLESEFIPIITKRLINQIFSSIMTNS